MRNAPLWFALLVCIVGPARATAQSAAASAIQTGAPDAFGATLSPGDKIQITVWRMPELSGEYTVTADGTIAHPLYHAIHVAGVPLVTVEERVRGVLARFETNAQFVVRPLFSVAVGGEVRLPNLYSLAPETTIAQAVAQAGGATSEGTLDQVRVLRAGRVLVLDLTQPSTQLGNLSVRSGDQIEVARRRSLFRDYIVPLGSVTAGVAGVVSLLLRH